MAPTAAVARLPTDDPTPGTDIEPSADVDPRHPGSAGLSARVGGRGRLQDVTPPVLVDAIVNEAGVDRAVEPRSARPAGEPPADGA